MSQNTSVYYEASPGPDHSLGHSPITKDGIRQISTPLAGQGIDDLARYDLDPLSPVAGSPASRDATITESPPNQFHPVKVARAVFSPAKDVVALHSPRRMSQDPFSHHQAPASSPPAPPPPPDHRRRARSALADPALPYVLSMYLQLAVNVVVVAVVLYFGWVFVRTINADIRHKLELYTADALHEISLCSREYYRNKCAGDNGAPRAPALEKTCTAWAKCMNRDPDLIGKSRITAETFADVVNGFFRPISWKALVFMSMTLVGSLVMTNVGFSSYRQAHAARDDRIEQLELTIREKDSLIERYQSESYTRTNTTAVLATGSQSPAFHLDSSPLSGKLRRSESHTRRP